MHDAVRLGIDVGKARIGVARTDAQATMAVPVETVPRDDAAVTRIIRIAHEYEAGMIYVGLPLSLKGQATPSTDDALEFAHLLQAELDIPVRMIDERLSTVSASASLQQAGHSAKSAKGIIDQAAAVVILEQALSTERARNEWAGSKLNE